MKTILSWTLLALMCFPNEAARSAEYDVVVYGGNSAGVIAAVQAKKMGKSVVIVCPDKHLGGLSSGGLGFTDTGNKAVIGGLSREFYHRVWKHYDQDGAWKWQKKSEYGNKGQGTPAIDGEQRTMWIFEPHVAEKVFEDFVREFQIPTHRNEWLDRSKGVTKSNGRIASITMLSGKTYSGKMFIDATYEGDLMAAAGINYHVGREAKSVYDEQWNGIQTGVLHHKHHFGAVKTKISPYLVPDDPKSGVLPRVSADPPGEHGAGDKRVQAYCYRMCLSNDPKNLIPFSKPEGYDPKQYELLVRIFEAGWRETFEKFDPIPNHKTDTNNHGPMSTDNIGMNYDYPEASYERRREILKEHEKYQKGWLYFIANDPRVPKDVQSAMQKWGLPKDEFTDNGGWSHQIYVREARRMIGQFVMTENELLKKKPTPDSVGMGSYTIDSHNVQRYITPDGYVQNEGDIGVGLRGPYEIAYGSLVPKRGQCDNLLVPVCVSSSHIAFGSIRMEPVFMILGQSAATAAVMAIDADQAVQDVPYSKLRERLLKDGQVLEHASPTVAGKGGIDPAKLTGIVVDDAQAKLTGDWNESHAAGTWIGTGYRHDGNVRDNKAAARFETKLAKSGRYEVRLAYPPNANRSSQVAIEVHHAQGQKLVTINQRLSPPIDEVFVSLGEFDFSTDQPAAVIVTNRDTNGYVVIDAVQWIAAEKQRSETPDQSFEQIAKRYIDESPALSPIGATTLGDHRFDSAVDDVSDAARQRERAFYQRLLAELAKFEKKSLSRENQVDFQLLTQQLRGDVWRLDVLQEWAWNPVAYTQLTGGAIYGLMAREFAPVEKRLMHVADRLEKMPKLYEQIRGTLDAKRVPPIHAETAAKQNRGLISILDNMVKPQMGKLSDAERARLEKAMATATNAVEQHQKWLEKELQPNTKGNFRIGAKLFDPKLEFSLGSKLSRPEIRDRAEFELRRVRAEMYSIARSVILKADPKSANDAPEKPSAEQQQKVIVAALEKAYAEIPARDGIVDFAKKSLEMTTEFVRKHDLVTIPPDPLDIILMPEFQRGVSIAYCDSPGPLDVGQKTYYAVSPIPDDWTDKQVGSFLREYNFRSIHDLTIHEAMPGHFLQIAHSNRSPRRLRALLSSGTFVEGWGVYAEQLMTEEGFLDRDPLMRLICLKWYLRGIANAILDQAIHVDGMNREDAMKLMVHDTFQEEREAALKWVRAQLTSTQLSTYFVGYQEHRDLRTAAEKAWADKFTLKRYHDGTLSFGSPPVRFVKALLLDEPIPE